MGNVQSIAESGGVATIITLNVISLKVCQTSSLWALRTAPLTKPKNVLRGAFHASKIDFPKQRITINLAPADIPKESSSFDLGIAVAIMQAAGLITR